MKGIPRGGANTDQVQLSPGDEQRLMEKLYAKLPAPDPAATPTESTQPTVEHMKQKLEAAIQISGADLDALAHHRAEAVQQRLLENGKLTEERMSLLDPGAAELGHEKVRTQLGLSAGS
jgi:hypothetical protein